METKRRNRVQVMLTDEEFDRLVEAAEKAGMKTSAYGRDIFRKALGLD